MLPSDDTIARTAEELFDIREFRPGQKEIIKSVLNGGNTLAVLPTGAGKSLTYQLPAMMMEGLTLVITPLISLMKDQVAGLRERGIMNCDYLSSGRSFTETSGILDRIEKLKILYVTPERLESRPFRERLLNSGARIPLVAVDEAHCISLWGGTFRPSYRRIGDFLSAFPGATVAAFTGTASRELREDILKNLGRKNWNVIAMPMERKNIAISVTFVEDKVRHLCRTMDDAENTIVYTSSKTVSERLDYIFSNRGFSSTVYHAGLTAEARAKNQELFMEGRKKIMVATSAFGMGIDKKDIRSVCHYHIPFGAEEYYQEIGRAGRDGKESRAEMLVEPGDAGEMDVRMEWRYPCWKTVRRMIAGRDVLPSDARTKKELSVLFSLEDFKDIGDHRKEYLIKRNNVLAKAAFMKRFASQSGCRGVALMGYFGEVTGPCGKCDYCRAAAANYYARDWTDGEIRMIAALGGFRGKVRIEDLRNLLIGFMEKERLKSGFGSLRGTDRKVFGGIVSRLKNFHVLEFDVLHSSVGPNPLFKKWLDSN